MAVNTKLSGVNWEKVTVYLTITIAFLSLCSQLFKIKDTIKDMAVQIGKLEVKVEKLEEGKK